MKKRGLLVAVLTGAIALAAIGGTVFAQATEEEGTRNGFTQRVAEILGLETGVVEDAMRQAASEIRDERLQAHLDRLVESGKLTQEQADEYLEWFEARPEWSGRGFGPMVFGPKADGLRGFGMMGPRGHSHRVFEFRGGPAMRFHFYQAPSQGQAEASSMHTPSGVIF